VRFRDLPSRQKREIAALVAAGIASAALVFTRLVVPIADDIALAATPRNIQLAAAPVLWPTAPARIEVPAARARSARQPLAPNALPTTGRLLSAPAVQSTARVNDDRTQSMRAARRSLIMCVLFGDGRYRVRSFPSPTDPN